MRLFRTETDGLEPAFREAASVVARGAIVVAKATALVAMVSGKSGSVLGSRLVEGVPAVRGED